MSAKVRWNGQATIAVITALAAIFGAAVGGAATYLGNRSLQQSQNHDAARGAARVLQAEFVNATTSIEVELKEQRLIVFAPSLSTINISEEDEKLIASNVSASAWDHIAAAEAVLEEEAAARASNSNVEMLKARAGLHVPLQGPSRQFAQSAFRTLAGADEALKELSGTTSSE